MSEEYPSDNALLNIQSDSETGVEYIATGQAPYYLHFRKLLYRLLLATKRANDLRVYDDGGLDIGVRSGSFWLGTQLVSYPGSSGNALAYNKENIYVYLDSAGNLVTDEYSGFPDMVTTPHVRLAIVSTGSGSIDSITDRRGNHLFGIPYASGGVHKVIEAHLSNDTLSQAESGSVHSNLGASGAITLTLPASASAGTLFTFAVQAANELRVDPGSAAIRDDSGTTVDKYKTCSTVGACLTVVADSNGNWNTIGKNGNWTQEA